MIVGSSCTAELIQDDPGGLAASMGLPVPVVPLELPSYQKKENWGAAETFYRLVRALSGPCEKIEGPSCNILGPTALGFRHRDDVAEITRLLGRLGIRVNVAAPMGAHAAGPQPPRRRRFQRRALPRDRRARGAPSREDPRPAPHADGADRHRRDAGLHRRGRRDRRGRSRAGARRPRLRQPWYSASVDSTYLTGKRVFVFGDATHAIAAARVAAEEMGFEVVGLGTYTRDFAREVRAAAGGHGLEALVTDDYLEVEAAIAEAAPELILGTQMERHIGKRLNIPCAVISAPVHVQDYPARYSPQMGIEGANVLFDTWVHPLVMGLEEHLLAMFREDFEFHDDAGPSHLGGHATRARTPRRPRRRRRPRPGPGRRSRPRREGARRPRTPARPERPPRLGGRRREGAEEDPVLRARQGPAQHRSLRRRVRHRNHHCRDPL